MMAGMAFADMTHSTDGSGTTVTGYADIRLNIVDEAADDTPVAGKNENELKTKVWTEVDFEKKSGQTTVRIDLDFPVSDTAPQAEGISTSSQIEQAKFVWASAGAVHGNGAGHGINFTGGAFNSPIGSEHQDAPYRWFADRGQLASLLPANIAGFMVSLTESSSVINMPHTLDVFFGNEWVDNNAEDNTTGVLFGITPVRHVNLKAGYLTSEDSVVDATTDVVLSITPHVVLEYLTNETQDGWSITGHLPLPHQNCAVAARYDSVEEDDSDDDASTSLTLSVSHEFGSNLTTRLEWRTHDSGESGDSSDDLLTLQFVAKL